MASATGRYDICIGTRMRLLCWRTVVTNCATAACTSQAGNSGDGGARWGTGENELQQVTVAPALIRNRCETPGCLVGRDEASCEFRGGGFTTLRVSVHGSEQATTASGRLQRGYHWSPMEARPDSDFGSVGGMIATICGAVALTLATAVVSRMGGRFRSAARPDKLPKQKEANKPDTKEGKSAHDGISDAVCLLSSVSISSTRRFGSYRSFCPLGKG